MEEGRREVKPPLVQPSKNSPPLTPPPQKCPRCESLKVKFCYYNNYCISQLRYFCKACQRYWTHGGTVRNILEGGGCRRPKRAKNVSSVPSGNSASQQGVAASHQSSGGVSSSSVPLNLSHPTLRLFSFLVNRQAAQNLRQTNFYQRANQVLRILNQTLENSHNNNINNNSNNYSNPNYGPPSS